MSKNKVNQSHSKLNGTLGLEDTLIQKQGKIRYDEAGKSVLRRKEVLANILKYSLPEYEQYSCEEIMTFIDTTSIQDDVTIAPDTDTRISGDDTVQSSVSDANLTFDVLFQVLRPEKNKIHLHVDVELQGSYWPGYPLEKRGIYNLSRMISSQLDVVNKKTNYDKLEKAYCIFICVGRVPMEVWNSVSYYEFVNTKNIGPTKVRKESYDLMGLLLIRIGTKSSEGVSDIIHFLHGLFYDIEEVKEYIDFSQNESFRRELEHMALLGDHLIELGEERQREKMEQEVATANRRAKEEKKRAEEEKKRAEKAENKVKQLMEEMERLREKAKKV